MTAPTVMQFSRVSRSFNTPSGQVNVLNKIDLTVHKGEFLMITGPSGSGKSTLLHICALIDQPSAGSVRVSGQITSGMNESELCHIRKKSIGIVFQNFCLLPHRSAFDNVMFRFRYQKDIPGNAPELAGARLKEMGLADVAQRRARLLSSGEKQRVAIARAMVLEPLLLLADEPTGNLDSKSSQIVMNCFSSLNRRGMTIVMVTHNEALLSYATRHLVCAGGRLQNAGLQ